ncbi:2-keto-4-pentenoate hydratase [Niveispirillum sp. SYP-B3756]|uniref:2-keto-4-pentenoate hydratase n=1 Tax=Niveispirillum sp. SYP-B3756 TaxID=2662178 RepID=UPI0012923360|nr:fumarylacetoacetate hydrolase family protein [Niveispirillum sp. SYP-B3756]MQP66583.1 2-keto-4-pentenoate hydratase [Niveispirillum sp. SYP-B3756]
MPDNGDDLTADIRRAFRDARRAGRSLPDYPGTIPATLEAAYLIQNAAIREWPDAVAGWKIGLIPPGVRDLYPQERLAGPIFARTVHVAEPGEIVDIRAIEGGFTAVEAELLLHIACDIAPGSVAEDAPLPPLIAAAHLGIEPAGSPLSAINDLGPAVVVSDFGNNAGVVIGQRLAGDLETLLGPEPPALRVETLVNGERIGEKPLTAIPGGPGRALRFLLRNLGRRGITLPQGAWISTGAITGVHRVEPGDEAMVTMEGVGELKVRFVPAQPLE